jgi:phospho-N-acetylmuramoyl-pentapeptide-transferase
MLFWLAKLLTPHYTGFNVFSYLTVRAIFAVITGLGLALLLGPWMIEKLKFGRVGQVVRDDGPKTHFSKAGTPTMGGLLILVVATVSFLAVSKYKVPALTVLFVTLGCGAIGFLDDFIKLTHRRSLGLNGRWKLILLGAITVGVGIAAQHQHLPTSVYIPAIGDLELSYAWYGLLFLVIAGAANGVNLTDGVDGLAAGTVIIALFTFASMVVISWIRSGPPGRRFDTKLDLAIIAAALIGGAIGFLWYNAWPAEVFMGDTGSMALGGALASFAIFTKTIFLLLLIGGIFAISALSVIIQVFTFKYLGRRVFLMAPIQHHFELKAWSETKIMVRFWVVTGILCSIGFALYYRYFTGFR